MLEHNPTYEIELNFYIQNNWLTNKWNHWQFKIAINEKSNLFKFIKKYLESKWLKLISWNLTWRLYVSWKLNWNMWGTWQLMYDYYEIMFKQLNVDLNFLKQWKQVIKTINLIK